MTTVQDGFVLMIPVCKLPFSHLCISSLCFCAHPMLISSNDHETSHSEEKSELHCQCWKVSYQGAFLIKLVPKSRLWETVHLLCKVARNPPAAHLQNFSSGLHRRRRFGEMPLFFIIPPLSLSLLYLIHISWRALEVWNCLKLIHYWIFSPRLKSLASLPHNSVPIDCLGRNISQGCTEHFSRDFLKLYQCGFSALNPCK